MGIFPSVQWGASKKKKTKSATQPSLLSRLFGTPPTALTASRSHSRSKTGYGVTGHRTVPAYYGDEKRVRTRSASRPRSVKKERTGILDALLGRRRHQTSSVKGKTKARTGERKAVPVVYAEKRAVGPPVAFRGRAAATAPVPVVYAERAAAPHRSRTREYRATYTVPRARATTATQTRAAAPAAKTTHPVHAHTGSRKLAPADTTTTTNTNTKFLHPSHPRAPPAHAGMGDRLAGFVMRNPSRRAKGEAEAKWAKEVREEERERRRARGWGGEGGDVRDRG